MYIKQVTKSHTEVDFSHPSYSLWGGCKKLNHYIRHVRKHVLHYEQGPLASAIVLPAPLVQPGAMPEFCTCPNSLCTGGMLLLHVTLSSLFIIAWRIQTCCVKP